MSEEKLKAVEDLAELALFAKGIWEEYWTPRLPLGQPEYMIEKFQSEKAMREQVKNDNYHYFYISSDEKIVGYTGLSLKGSRLFLSKLYILKEFRNSGYGRQAFEKIKEFAKAHGKSEIYLTVNKGNAPTIAAYKNWGFSTTECVVTDIGNGYVMDDYIMTYVL